VPSPDPSGRESSADRVRKFLDTFYASHLSGPAARVAPFPGKDYRPAAELWAVDLEVLLQINDLQADLLRRAVRRND
jgi:hypothetical protein